MAEWRPFGATNDEGTCLWCGKRLRWKRYAAEGWYKNGGVERAAAGEPTRPEPRLSPSARGGTGAPARPNCPQ